MKSKNDIIGSIFKMLNSKLMNLMDAILSIALLGFAAYGGLSGNPSLIHLISLLVGLLSVFLYFNKPSKVVEKALRETVTKKKPGSK